MDTMSTLSIFPEKSQFKTDQSINLLLKVSEHLKNDEEIVLTVLKYHHVLKTIATSLRSIRHSSSMVDIGTFPVGGYRVIATIRGKEIAFARTAFDVREHWRDAPRYGFISDYEVMESYQHLQDFFRKFHLNVVQFYDWMERHDALAPKSENFVDPMGRKLTTTGILSRIRAMSEIGATSFGYAAVYASMRDYAESHRNEGIFDNQGVQHSLIDIFFLMDITKESSWRKHILDEFERAIQFGFSGLHLDQYGYPKSAQRSDGSAFWLDEAYMSFINACKSRLGDNVGLIFNNVSSYPVQTTSQAQQDAIYVEVWPPMIRYRHLSDLAGRIRAYTDGHKQIILAAYLKPFKETRDANPDAVARSALLVTAVIFASGGYHLVLGESGGMLTEPYYPDYVPITPVLVEPLRAMYDMVTADADLFSGPSCTDVSWSFVGGINDCVIVDGAPISVEPEAGTIWVRVVMTAEGLVIHLINLLWVEHDEWNAIHEEAFYRTPPLKLRIEWNHTVDHVLIQKAEGAIWEPQDCEWVEHVRGMALQVSVLSFDVWTVVFVPYGGGSQPTEH